MEKRVALLEEKVEIITQALLKLQEWMEEVNTINEIDQTLLDDLNERVTEIETEIEQLSSTETVKKGGGDD